MRHTINAEARQKETSAARKGSSVWGHTMDASQQLHDELSLSGWMKKYWEKNRTDKSHIAQYHGPTLCNPRDWAPRGFPVHGIL